MNNDLPEGSEGFNRNIVECKYETPDFCRWRRWVLIETLWNVNSGTDHNGHFRPHRFNRNIVECK